MDAPVSINPSTKWLFISTKRCNVILRWFLWTLVLFTMVGLSTLVKLIDFSSSSCYFFANLIMLSKDLNIFGITKMVSMGDNEIFPFMKCINILDLVGLLLRSTCPTLQSLTNFPYYFYKYVPPRYFGSSENIMLCTTQSIQLLQHGFFFIHQNF